MTRKFINQFMWGYQEHFRISIEILARESLGSLSPDLATRALLIGARAPGAEDPREVCVEPEDGDVPQILFEGLEARIQQLIAEDPRQKTLYGDEPSNRDKPKWIRSSSVRAAVMERLARFDSDADTRSFCGEPGTVGKFEVTPVLQVKAGAFAALPQLRRTATWHSDFQAVPSLAHAVIDCLLGQAREGLFKPEPGHSPGAALTLNAAEVMRRAGESFSFTPTWAGKMTDSLGELFEPCCRIAAQRYENRQTRARIVLAEDGHPFVEQLIKFQRPVALRATRWARKMIEMASGDLSALCDGAHIRGIGRLRPNYDTSREDAFVLQFLGSGAWDLLHGDTVLMRVLHGVPSLPRPPIPRDRFMSNLRRVVAETSEEGTARIWDVVSVAIGQRHGTMVVVSSCADEEAERLAAQATRIEPTFLSRDLVPRVSEIDGAILVDPSGRCHAVGVILDGRSSSEGTPARGARYNSAIRYVRDAPRGTMAVVVSEDGDIEMVPLLKPQILRSKLLSVLGTVEELRRTAEPDLDLIHDTARWLDAHRFYLSPQECVTVNGAMKEFYGAFMNEGRIWIWSEGFSPDPGMNATYFFPEASAEVQ